jgi:hypothetical protein
MLAVASDTFPVANIYLMHLQLTWIFFILTDFYIDFERAMKGMRIGWNWVT